MTTQNPDDAAECFFAKYAGLISRLSQMATDWVMKMRTSDKAYIYIYIWEIEKLRLLMFIYTTRWSQETGSVGW